MAQAEVGALRVVLGMDIAEFSEGGRKAEDVLGRLATRLGIVAGVASAAGTMIGNALTSAAESLVNGVKKAIDGAAEMAEAADKFGLSIETVSAMVAQGEVPIETLKAGLDGLQQSIFKVASDETTSAAVRAFNAIGVSALDASGQMRSVSDVLSDVADKFATYRDGIAKDALATDLFGRKGAELVGILSKGSAGIKEMTGEAKELGTALDRTAGAQAQAFKGTLSDISKSFDTFYRQLAVELLPVLKFFSDKLGEWASGPGSQSATVAKFVGDSFKWIAASLIEADGWLVTWGLRFSQIVREVPEVLKFNFDEARKIVDETNLAIKLSTEDTAKAIAKLYDQSAGEKKDKPKGGQQDAPQIQTLKELSEAEKELNKSISAGQALALQALEPYELLGKKLDNLGDAYDAAKISAEALGRAQQQATLIAVGAYANAASGIAGSLSQVFSKSKAVAIAAATINSFQAATNALAQAPWPLNYVAAAAALAAGFTQVANIRRTTESSGGGGGAASSAPATGGPTQAPQTLVVQGISTSSLFTGDSVKALANQLLAYQRDGGQVVLA